MDGTVLIRKYKGQILTAIVVDGNMQVLPLAFAFVEGESTDSWYWFLERVKTAIVMGQPNICVIDDEHAGLLQAIKELKYGQRGDVWPETCKVVHEVLRYQLLQAIQEQVSHEFFQKALCSEPAEKV